jgi:hypothetical protein
MAAVETDVRVPGLLEACDDERIFGVELTPGQRELLVGVEGGGLLHVWALGRRSGKTLLSTLLALWFCALRPDLARQVRRRERRYAACVATNLRQAQIVVRQAAEIVEGSMFLKGLVEKVTDDEVAFKVGTSLVAFPCTSRGGRGWPVMFLAMDEAAHFIDGEGNSAAEPVFRALMPSVAQFGTDARVVVASSPYGTDGFFADLYGTVEKGALPDARHAQAATLDMRPDMATAAMELERRRDPEGFRAEYGAEFVAAGSSFFDPGRLTEAIRRPRELRPGEVLDPVAAIDLGFVHDSTALAILGRDRTDESRLRLVLARSWSPELGPLGFTPTLDEIASVCREHRVERVYCDQFSAQAAVEHLQRRGLSPTVAPTTAASKSEMFASLKTRLYAGALEFYDQPDLLAELRRVETVTTPGQASVRIRRLGASHGDLAVAVALAVSKLGDRPRIVMRTFVPQGRIDGGSELGLWRVPGGLLGVGVLGPADVLPPGVVR